MAPPRPGAAAAGQRGAVRSLSAERFGTEDRRRAAVGLCRAAQRSDPRAAVSSERAEIADAGARTADTSLCADGSWDVAGAGDAGTVAAGSGAALIGPAAGGISVLRRPRQRARCRLTRWAGPGDERRCRLRWGDASQRCSTPSRQTVEFSPPPKRRGAAGCVPPATEACRGAAGKRRRSCGRCRAARRRAAAKGSRRSRPGQPPRVRGTDHRGSRRG